MSEKSKPCPVCGGVMNFRLGEFQCSMCDHTEPFEQPKEDNRFTSQRARIWDAVVKRGKGGSRPEISASDDWTVRR